MSFNRPQTIGTAFAILTLFAAAAWGQQFGDLPVYESENAIFDSSIDFADLESADSDKQTTKELQQPNNVDSPFGSANPTLVNKDGYFVPSANGGLWKDTVEKKQSTTRVASTRSSIIRTKNEPAAQDSVLVDSDTVVPEATVYGQPNVQQGCAQVADACPDSSRLRLRIGFDALLWERGRAEDVVFATDNRGQEWSFGDFDFTEGEARYFIQYMSDDLTGFEFTFFDFNSFESVIDAEGDTIIPLFFQASPAQTSNNYNFEYSSRLKNIELNSWLRKNSIQRDGYGFRHINLDEQFNVLVGTNNGLFSRADNDLWGFNRMWERRRPILDRLTLTGGADVGLYINRVSVDIDSENIDDHSEENNLAGSLGFNVGVEYLVANHVTFRFGYEGLGLFGVGLASEQSLQQSALDGLDDPELGSIYFGGFYIGAIAAF